MVEAIGTIAGSSLEQTTWLRRNLEVKASPQIVVDGANLEADVEGVQLYTLTANEESSHESLHIAALYSQFHIKLMF